MKFGKQIRDQLDRLKSSFSKRKPPSLPKTPKAATPPELGGMPPKLGRNTLGKIKEKLNPKNWKKPDLKAANLKLNKENLGQWREKWSNGLSNLGNMSLDRIPRDFKFTDKSIMYMNIAAVAMVSYFTADLAATIINPKIPERKVIKRNGNVSDRPKSLDDYAIITDRNLFNKDGLIPSSGSLSPDLSGPAVKSSLPLDLVGVILVKDRLKSVASVNDRSANQVISVKINEPINKSAILKEIERDRIIFFNNRTNRKEFIELPKDKSQLRLTTRAAKPSAGAGITKVSDTQMSIDRSEVDKALGNLNQILTQARCTPHTENGRPAGYRCYQIVPGSIYDKIGMKNGDIICGINGEEISDMSKALKLFEELKTSTRIELCIKRNRQTMNMVYDIQ